MPQILETKRISFQNKHIPLQTYISRLQLSFVVFKLLLTRICQQTSCVAKLIFLRQKRRSFCFWQKSTNYGKNLVDTTQKQIMWNRKRRKSAISISLETHHCEVFLLGWMGNMSEKSVPNKIGHWNPTRFVTWNLQDAQFLVLISQKLCNQFALCWNAQKTKKERKKSEKKTRTDHRKCSTRKTSFFEWTFVLTWNAARETGMKEKGDHENLGNFMILQKI